MNTLLRSNAAVHSEKEPSEEYYFFESTRFNRPQTTIHLTDQEIRTFAKRIADYITRRTFAGTMESFDFFSDRISRRCGAGTLYGGNRAAGRGAFDGNDGMDRRPDTGGNEHSERLVYGHGRGGSRVMEKLNELLK